MFDDMKPKFDDKEVLEWILIIVLFLVVLYAGIAQSGGTILGGF